MTAAVVTAVIVAYNSADDLRELLPLLDDPRVDVIVLDNASPDDSAAVVEQHAHVQLVRVGRNAGWSVACNLGAARAGTAAIAFVNPDARPSPDVLVDLANRLGPDSSCVTPRFVGVDGEQQAFFFRFPTAWSGLFTFLNAGKRIDRWLGRLFIRRRTYEFGTSLPVEIDQPGAACLVVDADLFTAMDGFDPDMWLFFSDTDWCLRARRRGLGVVVAADVVVVHEGGGSVGHWDSSSLQQAFQRDYVVYARKHYSLFGRAVTVVGVWVLAGLLPAGAALARGRPTAARARVAAARSVVRRVP
jgi:N-acetylglucosaminyl-diphospho-decaprenol L-rhamnosyltransferase